VILTFRASCYPYELVVQGMLGLLGGRITFLTFRVLLTDTVSCITWCVAGICLTAGQDHMSASRVFEE